jgi:transcriptional regulator with XRE-family HTH domain
MAKLPTHSTYRSDPSNTIPLLMQGVVALIRQHRLHNRWSYTDFSKRTGIQRSVWCATEHNRRPLTPNQLHRIQQTLGIDLTFSFQMKVRDP